MVVMEKLQSAGYGSLSVEIAQRGRQFGMQILDVLVENGIQNPVLLGQGQQVGLFQHLGHRLMKSPEGMFVNPAEIEIGKRHELAGRENTLRDRFH